MTERRTLTLDEAREHVRKSGKPSLAEIMERFKPFYEACDAAGIDPDVSGQCGCRTIQNKYPLEHYTKK